MAGRCPRQRRRASRSLRSAGGCGRGATASTCGRCSPAGGGRRAGATRTMRPEPGHDMPLAAMLSAALAVSEAFRFAAGEGGEAGRRAVGLSLWRPAADCDWLGGGREEPALGYLPSQVWLIGLGHLGQATSGGWGCSRTPTPAGLCARPPGHGRDHPVVGQHLGAQRRRATSAGRRLGRRRSGPAGGSRPRCARGCSTASFKRHAPRAGGRPLRGGQRPRPPGARPGAGSTSWWEAGLGREPPRLPVPAGSHPARSPPGRPTCGRRRPSRGEDGERTGPPTRRCSRDGNPRPLWRDAPGRQGGRARLRGGRRRVPRPVGGGCGQLHGGPLHGVIELDLPKHRGASGPLCRGPPGRRRRQPGVRRAA